MTRESLPPPTLEIDFLNLSLRAQTGEMALRELHEGLSQTAGINSPARFQAELLARNSLGPSCLSSDIALPHVRTSAVDRIILAVGRSAAGIEFSQQYPRIRLVFMMGVPLKDTDTYLYNVASLARCLRQPALMNAFYNAETGFVFLESWDRAFRHPVRGTFTKSN